MAPPPSGGTSAGARGAIFARNGRSLMGALVALRGQVAQHLHSCCRSRTVVRLCRLLRVVGYIRNNGVERGRTAQVL